MANNVLALYMQDRYLGKMNRVADDITVAPEYLEESNNQHGHVAVRVTVC